MFEPALCTWTVPSSHITSNWSLVPCVGEAEGVGEGEGEDVGEVCEVGPEVGDELELDF